MSELTSDSDAAWQSDRLTRFQSEVDELKVTGGAANPERNGAKSGAVLMGAGVVLTIVAIIYANGGNTDDKLDALSIAACGIAVTMVGVALWLRNSMTRYLRFWLIRLVYEQREQTDRIVNNR